MLRFLDGRGRVCCEADSPADLCTACFDKWRAEEDRRLAAHRVPPAGTPGLRSADYFVPVGPLAPEEAAPPPPDLYDRIRTMRRGGEDANPRILKYLRARLGYDRMTD